MQISSTKYLTIFILEILAFLSLSFMEVFIEGPNGGFFLQNGLEFFGLRISIWAIITLPLLLAIPIVAGWFDSKLVGIVLIGYLVGLILEDFFWFVINPYYGIQKFSSQFVAWMYWIRIFSLQVPLFYVTHSLLAIVSWFVFVKNSDKINNLYKKLIK
jgi:hypothetical protein